MGAIQRQTMSDAGWRARGIHLRMYAAPRRLHQRLPILRHNR